MPKNSKLKSILIIGSGPIVIGQACEFDYSGTQALRSLREDGIETILINSNPNHDRPFNGRSCILVASYNQINN